MSEIITLFGSHFKVSGILHSVPLEWFTPSNLKYSAKILRPIPNKKYIKRLKQKSYLVTLTLLVILGQVIYATISNSAGNPVMYLLLAFMLLAFNFYHNYCQYYASEVAININGLIQFDYLYPKPPRKFTDMTVRELLSNVFVRSISATELFLPMWAVFGLSWNQPHFVGYWLIPNIAEGQTDVVTTRAYYGLKTIMLAYHFWLWVFVLKAAFFVVGLIHNLSITILIRNFDIFAELCTKQSTEKLIYDRAKLFKHIQLLVTLLNAFHKGQLIMALIAAPIIVAAFTLSVLFMNAKIDLIRTGIYLLLIFQTVTEILVILGQMAAIYLKSTAALKMVTWKKIPRLPTNIQKWEHRFYQSCQPLKVMIAGVNFVDSFTSLNCLEILVSLTANILLLEGVNKVG